MTNSAKRSPLMQRVLTGGIMLVVFLAALFFLTPIAWACLMLLVLVAAAIELGRLLGSDHFAHFGLDITPYYSWLMPLGLLVAAASFVLIMHRLTQVEIISLLCACYFIALLLSVTLIPFWIRRNESGKLNITTFVRGGFAIIPGWLLFCGWLAAVQLQIISPWALLMVMVLIWLADSAAYFVGRALGRNKLAPKTSPGKSREGALGALAAASFYALATAPWVLPHLSVLHALPTAAQWAIYLVLAWLLTILSILGDLFESLIKRAADRKDSSNLLPGHGGVLDRIDSLLTTLPVAALLVAMLI